MQQGNSDAFITLISCACDSAPDIVAPGQSRGYDVYAWQLFQKTGLLVSRIGIFVETFPGGGAELAFIYKIFFEESGSFCFLRVFGL